MVAVSGCVVCTALSFETRTNYRRDRDFVLVDLVTGRRKLGLMSSSHPAVMAPAAQRLAALVMPRLDADRWSEEEYRADAYDLIDQGVRSFGVFCGTLEATISLLQDLQRYSPEKLFFGADYEHGLPMRLRDGGIAFPRAMAMGKTSAGITEHLATAIAHETRAVGVHWNWAPVADMNSDPANPIVNTRAFGETSAEVAPHVQAYIRGMQSAGVLACAKHLPGHGATQVDSHLALPSVDVSLDVLQQREFVPFRAAIEAGVGSLMMGHLRVPALDPDLPASLSARIITDLVRTEWGFDGLITTDALDMGAITNQWSSSEAAVAAFCAGNDVILLPADPREAIHGLAAAYADGRISDERLQASEQRWNTVRRTYGTPSPLPAIDQNIHALMALQAATAALRIVGDEGLLPLQRHGQIAAFAVIDERDADTATTWFHYLAQATELDIDMGYIDGTITEHDLQGLVEGTMAADVVVFAFFGRAVAHRGYVPGYERIPEIMDVLSTGRPRIIVAAGSPYGISSFSSDCTLYTYSDTVPSLAASVLRLIGREPASTSQP